MIELYQELIPFSNNKNPDAVSQNGTLSNPIIMPLSLDVTSMYTTVEAVIYIRNNDPTKWYKNVLVSLMAPARFLDLTTQTDQYGNQCPADQFEIKSIYYDAATSHLNMVDDSNINRIRIPVTYCSEMLPTDSISDILTYDKALWFDGRTNSSYLPCDTTLAKSGVAKRVYLSYGYDELSQSYWDEQLSTIIIPSIGNANMPDTSYIPIRIRIDIQQNSTILSSLSDYAINIMYEREYNIGEV